MEMITKQQIIDAFGRVVADVKDGVWDLSAPEIHPAIQDLVNAANHPDLVDRDGDTWAWYEGYSYSGNDLWSRDEIEIDFGPVREA